MKLANGNRIYFKSFKTDQIETFVEFVRANELVGERIHATGGGAHKFADLLEREFTQSGVQVVKHDEMASLANGLTFATRISTDQFVLDSHGSPSFDNENEAEQSQTSGSRQEREEEKASEAPKLLVSIGTGVSMIKVTGFNIYKRVGGTMIGGGTLLGLSSLLTGISDFDTITAKAQRGENSNVDLLVRDIYGDNSALKELKGDRIASSFAKAATSELPEATARLHREEDLLSSLVTMISLNTGQLAYFLAKLHKIE